MYPVGCLLIGETVVATKKLAQSASAAGIFALEGKWSGNLLRDMQQGFYRVQRQAGRACVLAEGAMWAAALALAVQLSVDCIVLVNPSNRLDCVNEMLCKQLSRLRSYVKRNLFSCVSDVLVIGAEESGMYGIFSRMTNARIWSSPAASRDEALSAAVHFLKGDLPGQTEYGCELR